MAFDFVPKWHIGIIYIGVTLVGDTATVMSSLAVIRLIGVILAIGAAFLFGMTRAWLRFVPPYGTPRKKNDSDGSVSI